MSEFINEESKLLKEEKQVIWEMFVDWYPFFQKKILCFESCDIRWAQSTVMKF